jgi:hypothetical protein
LTPWERRFVRQRLEGDPGYDFGWMWRELGLDRSGCDRAVL